MEAASVDEVMRKINDVTADLAAANGFDLAEGDMIHLTLQAPVVLSHAA